MLSDDGNMGSCAANARVDFDFGMCMSHPCQNCQISVFASKYLTLNDPCKLLLSRWSGNLILDAEVGPEGLSNGPGSATNSGTWSKGQASGQVRQSLLVKVTRSILSADIQRLIGKGLMLV